MNPVSTPTAQSAVSPAQSINTSVAATRQANPDYTRENTLGIVAAEGTAQTVQTAQAAKTPVKSEKIAAQQPEKTEPVAAIEESEAGDELGVEDEVSYVVADGSPNEDFGNATGLFGGLGAAGLGGAAAGGLLPAALVAGGLAGLAALAGDDDDGAGADSGMPPGTTTNTNTGGPRTIIDDGLPPLVPVPPGTGGEPVAVAGGLFGGLQLLNSGLAQTALEPLNALTEPLADGLGTLGDALLNAGEPTGLSTLLGEVVGSPESGTLPVTDGGLVGLLTSVSAGLDEGVSTGPLEPLSMLINPLTQTLGASGGATDGVAQGLANVGTTLLADQSVLAPLTSDVLGPVVGTSPGQTDGVPQTLEQVGEGLTDLTNPASALAPLDALTAPLQDAVLQQLANGVEQVGDGLADFAGQDPSGITALLADTLGGDLVPAAAGTTNPLDGLTGLLGGAIPGADALSADGLTDLLGAGALSGISSGAGLPGLDTLTNALPV